MKRKFPARFGGGATVTQHPLGSRALPSTQLGVALHLYSENIADEPREPVDRNAMTPSESAETISKEKLAEIKQLRTSLKWKPEQVMDHAERLFGTRDIEKLNPVMGDAFIAYLKAQNGKQAAA